MIDASVSSAAVSIIEAVMAGALEDVCSVPAACVPRRSLLSFTTPSPSPPGVPLPSASATKQRGGDRNAALASGLLRAC